jgi:hypothetical protein
MATLGIQQQRIPMTDPRTGFITKEWLKILAGLGGEAAGAGVAVADVTAALAAAVARIVTLELQMAALTARVLALESVAEASDAFPLQPAPGPPGQQGEPGPQGEPGDNTFPPPLTPIPLEWPEELRSALELSGLY